MALVNETTPATAETPPAKTGFINYLRRHPTGFWFIFWGEFAERCSYYGMRAILATYMVDKLGFSEADSGTYTSLFFGAAYFLPLLGGYLADNFFGKYRTIVAFSLPYVLGHFILGIENIWFLLFALALLAMGSGVIKPNISTLMGMTYDQQRPGQDQLKSTAFSMFYMAINIGAGISQLAIPLIKESYDYWVAFLFPAGLMAVAFVIFAAGKKHYAVEKIERKRRTPEEFMIQWQLLGRIGGLFLLVMFFWAVFDQSSSVWIFFARTYMDRSLFGVTVPAEIMQAVNSVLIVILLPVIAYLWIVLDRRGVKVRPTDKMILGFILTSLCMGVNAAAGLLAGSVEKTVGLRAYPKAKEDVKKLVAHQEYADFVVEERARRLQTSDVGKLREALAALELEDWGQEAIYRRQAAPSVVASAVGFVASAAPGGVLLASSSAVPPRTIVDYVRPENRVTMWWQVLAYVLLTVAEILISVTGLELAYTAAPKNMKSFVTGMWLVTVSLANFLINAPLVRLYPVMHPGMYFLMFTAIMLAVTVIFVFVARRFNRAVAATQSITQETTASAPMDGAFMASKPLPGSRGS